MTSSSQEIALGRNYFGPHGYPITVRWVKTHGDRSPSHAHDLTEIEHTHDFCELVIVLRGRGMHSLEGDAFPVMPGDVFILQEHQRHYFHQRQGLELINVMYDRQRLDFPERQLRKIPGYNAMFLLEPLYRRQHRFASRLHLPFGQLGDVEQMARQITQEVTAQAPGYEAILFSQLLQMIVFLSRAYSETTSVKSHALLRIGDLIGLLESELTRDWKLADLQQISHMSRSNLIRVFREAVGQPPIEYLIGLRLQKAAELLRTTDWHLTRVATEVGFNDSNYFSRQFRKIHHQSPSSYRRS